MYPARTVCTDAPGWNYAVNMRVMLQVLSPRMQDAEKADPSSQILWIGGDFEQRFGAYAEKKIVERLLVLQHECRQVVRNREDYMCIRNCQEILGMLGEPLLPSVGLALRAMAVSA